MRSPEDSGCEGPADTLLILITNAHDYLSLIIVTLSLIFVIWHMKQQGHVRPEQHTVTRWRRGGSRLNDIFYRHFFLGNQGQVFLFLHLIPNHIYALYWNAHFKIIQGTQSGRFFYTIIETYPSTLAAPVDISGRLQTNHMHCPQN